MAEAGIAGDFAADAFALGAQHLTHALELKNDTIDLLHRRSGHAPDQHVEVVDDRFRCRDFRIVAVTAQEGDVSPHELADLTFERGYCRLLGLGPLRRFPRRVSLRTGLFRYRPVQSETLGSDGRHGPLLQ